jgi:hypothetical protein
MITKLRDILDDYPGEASRTQCFTHILNLVAKSVLSQFDIPKKTKRSDHGASDNQDDDEDLDGTDWIDKEIDRIAGDIDAEEQAEVMAAQRDEAAIDNEDGLVDERATMSRRAIRELEKGVMPARHVLTKVGPCWSIFVSDSACLPAAKGSFCYQKLVHDIASLVANDLQGTRDVCKHNAP